MAQNTADPSATAAPPPIVVAAYSRPGALRRLLESLNAAYYPVPGVRLIISIDGGGPTGVKDVARSFSFHHGELKIVEWKKNLGLRQHILWCGDQAIDHGSAIVLEDDLIVDPYFYQFACRCLDAYSDEEKVAGIALYSPRYNEFAELPFEPLFNGTSNFFAQVPCSWGQAWSASQWAAFRNWYGKGEQTLVNDSSSLPDVVRRWPESSWKKYFSAYLLAQGRYFVYPYRSYTTNCSDPGGIHVASGTNRFQVPLGHPERVQETFTFQPMKEHLFKYDAYMEPEPDLFERWLDLENGSLGVDLYGIKSATLMHGLPLTLTSRPVRGAHATFPLVYRPIEANVQLREPISSSPFFSLADSERVLFDKAPVRERLIDYFSYSAILSLRFLVPGMCLALWDRLKRFTKKLRQFNASRGSR